MRISVVIYNWTFWSALYSYRVLLLLMRSLELFLVFIRVVLFQAPLLIVWTRLPVFRESRPPWERLAHMLEPGQTESISWLDMGVKGWGDARSAEDLEAVRAAINTGRKPISTPKVIVGGALRVLIVELGPTFIRWAQSLVLRPELTTFLREELRLLPDVGPTLKFKLVRELVHRELGGRDIEEVFSSIEEQPLLVSSIAQVHRGILVTGEDVDLKILRPYMRATVELDTLLITGVTRIMQLLMKGRRDWHSFDMSFDKSLKKEIDFFLEGSELERFYKAVNDNTLYAQCIKTPRFFRDMSTPKLLVTEHVDHICTLDHLGDLPLDEEAALLMRKVAQFPPDTPLQLYQAQLIACTNMLLDWGYVYAAVTGQTMSMVIPSDGDEGKVFISDFGKMFEIRGYDKECAIDFMMQLAYYCDGYGIADVLLRSMEYHYPEDSAKLDKREFRTALREFMRERRVVETRPELERGVNLEWRGSQLLSTEVVQTIFSVPGVKVPEWFWLIMRFLAYVEKSALTLCLNYDATDTMKWLAREVVESKVNRELDAMRVVNLERSMEGIAGVLNSGDGLKFLNETSDRFRVVSFETEQALRNYRNAVKLPSEDTIELGAPVLSMNDERSKFDQERPPAPSP